MERTFEDDLSVGQRDRISIDVSDIREQIEQCRTDVAWSELPLAAKIRVLVRERIAQLKAGQPIPSDVDETPEEDTRT